MTETMQFILSGITVGAVYALVALGFTLIYNALLFLMKFIPNINITSQFLQASQFLQVC